VITTAFAVALAAAQFAMSNGQPRRQPTLCDAMYYGLGRTADSGAAYTCYVADDDFEMQIILALNGDGVRRDVRRVEDLFSARPTPRTRLRLC
jgi:hypothetical protein